jgi:hypothetical protein
MATPSLLGIPIEVRLGIWDLVLSDKATVDLCEDGGRCHDRLNPATHSQPCRSMQHNPKTDLLLVSRSVAAEASAITKLLPVLVVESQCVPSLRRFFGQESEMAYVKRFQALDVVLRMHDLDGLVKPNGQAVTLKNGDYWFTPEGILPGLKGVMKLVSWDMLAPPAGLYIPRKLVLRFEQLKHSP